MAPLVSILIPAYNAQEWIADTIKSALAQTWSRKEIVVVDDGSRDQTLSVLRRFDSKDVKIVSQENQGAAAARNHALRQAQGEFIQWLDADDLLAPKKIALQMAVADQCDAKRVLLSGEWGYFIYRPSKAVFSPSPLWADLEPLEWLTRKWENNAHMQTATWLASRELTEAAGGWNTKLLGDDDGEYFFRVILASKGVRFCPGAKVFYRVSGASRLSNIGGSDRKRDAQFLGMQMQIRRLRELKDDARMRAACVKYLQDWLVYFYPERPDIIEQCQKLAAEMGGRIDIPALRWKYAWLKPLLGYSGAKRAQFVLQELKWTLLRAWDKALFVAGGRSACAELGG